MSQVQVFNFNDRQVRTIMQDGSPWWILKDVCAVLGLRSPDVRRRLTDDVVSTHSVPDSLGRRNTATVINEDGLYDVVLESSKPEARAFRKWVTKEVLPTIRKTGAYINTDSKAFKLMAKIDKASRLVGLLCDNLEVTDLKVNRAILSQVNEVLNEEIAIELANRPKPDGLGTAAIASFLGVSVQKVTGIVIKHQLKKPEYGIVYTYEFRGAPKEIFLFNEAGKEKLLELLGVAVHA